MRRNGCRRTLPPWPSIFGEIRVRAGWNNVVRFSTFWCTSIAVETSIDAMGILILIE
jgi:hypothetical protein